MKYVHRPGSHISDKQAALVGEAMGEIRASGRAVTPDTLTEYARPSSSKLHKLYDWDIRRLAEVALHERSRYLINSVVLLEVKTGRWFKPDYSVQIKTSATPDGQRAFHVRDIAISREDALEQIHKDFSVRLKTIAKEIRQTGIGKRYPNLRRIAVAIERNLSGRR